MREHVGTVALIGALLNAGAMAILAAAASESANTTWVPVYALWLAGGFGVFLVLGIVGRALARTHRSDSVQAVIFSLCGAAVSLSWALSTLQFGYVAGRPWRASRRGRPSTARSSGRADWSGPRAGETRSEEAAERWLRVALDEHASIAAFSRLSLDLLAHAAPPSLVRWASEAALEEIRHAELCFARASALGGREVGPSALPIGAAGAPSLAELARESLIDGAIGEGVAAACAARSATLATDRRARAVWSEIGRDEARHAELGWAIVEWALEQGGEAVAIELRRAMERLSPPAASQAPRDREQGWLGAGEERAAWIDVVSSARARLSLERRAA